MVYITAMQCVSAFSLAVNIGMITLYHRSPTHQMSPKLKDLFLAKLGSFLRVPPKPHSDRTIHPINNDADLADDVTKSTVVLDGSKYAPGKWWKEISGQLYTDNDWINLAKVIIRCFLILCASFVFLDTVVLLFLFNM